jgi:hypothetical protein
VLNKPLRQFYVYLAFVLNTKDLVANAAMKMGMNILFVERFLGNGIPGCVVLQNNLVDNTGILQRFERSIKRNTVKKIGKRSFYFVFSQSRLASKQLIENELPTGCTF